MSQTLLNAHSYCIDPFDQKEFNRHIQIARDQLGEAGFETLAAEGRAMTLEQAVECAMQREE